MTTPIHKESDPSQPKMMAVFHVQDPLTGEPVPVIREINERTTIADLIDWHRRNCLQPKLWKESWVNVRIISEAT